MSQSVYSLEIRRWFPEDYTDDAPGFYWELLSVLTKEQIAHFLRNGFTHPDHPEVIERVIGYSTTVHGPDAGVFYGHANSYRVKEFKLVK